MSVEQLAEVFASFCAFGSGAHGPSQLDNVKFAKLCRDCNIFCPRFTKTDGDLLFAKVKPKGLRTIDFNVFRQKVIPLIAEKKALPETELVRILVSSGGPASSGTVAASVALHDDKDTYTGVYRNGGPSTTDLATADLYYITNRQDADVRGLNRQRNDSGLGRSNRSRGDTPSQRGSTTTPRRSRSGSRPRSPRRSYDAGMSSATPEVSGDPLLQMLGRGETSNILSHLEGYRARGVPHLDDAIARLASALSSATFAAPPSAPPAQPMMRSPAAPAAHSPPPATQYVDPRRMTPGGGSGRGPTTSMREETSRMLEELFNSFCAFGAGQRGAAEMDNVKFAKFCRDTGLVDKRFNRTDVDLLFTRIKPKGGRTIGFQAFRQSAVPEIASRKGFTPDELLQHMRGGPQSTGTVADHVSLHDDKETYTGVYARGGPTNVDLQTADLCFITNRAPADVRGVQRSPM